MKMVVDLNKHKTTEIHLDDGSVWVVDGQCNQCGACCNGTGIKEYRDADGNCKHQKFVDGKSICLINVYKPYFCFLWPFTPNTELPKTCGFIYRRLK